MEAESSTLSAYSVVLRWVNGPSEQCEFPMDAFARALSHDLQGHNILLQHIISLKSIWHASWPSVRVQRRRLYVTDLKPRIERDLRRVQKLTQFSKSQIGVFRPNIYEKSTLPDSDNITLVLLNQAQGVLQQLLYEIITLPEDERVTKDILTEEILDRGEHPPCPLINKLAEENIGRSSVVLRIPELEAKKIIMNNTSRSPALAEDILKEEILDRAEHPPPCSVINKLAEENIGRSSAVLRIPELEAKKFFMKKPSGSPALAKDILPEEILDRAEHPPCSSINKLAEEHIGRPSMVPPTPELEAKTIIMKKPSGSPALVSCERKCAGCGKRPCKCWEKRRAQRNDSVISVDIMGPD